MPITVNHKAQYQFVRHGALTYSTNNVDCMGAAVMIHGEEISSLLELVSVQLVVKEIEIALDIGSAIDLDKNVKLPNLCSHEQTCQVGLGSYVLVHPEKNCHLSLIRCHSFRRVPLTQDGQQREALVSDETKTLLTLGATEVAPAGCKPVFTYRATEHPHLKVVTKDLAIADISNMQQHLEAGNLDLELELKVTASYMAYHLDVILNSQLASMGKKLCHMSRHTIETTELSPFHANSLIRVRGDLVQELSCAKVSAHVRVGENRDGKCYADSIPAWIHNEPVRIQAGTHLVLQQEAVETVNCNNSYAPIFVAADEKTLLSANPTVQVENITLHHLEEDYLHLGQPGLVEHDNYGEDFLYTTDEIARFNDLIHFQRVKKRVINNLVTDYCANNPACGSYQPQGEPAEPFNLQAVTDEITAPLTWFNRALDFLMRWGSLCSAFLFLFLWLLLGVKMINFAWLVCVKKFTVRQAAEAGLRYIIPVPVTIKEESKPEPAPQPAEPEPKVTYKNPPTYYSATNGPTMYHRVHTHEVQQHQDVPVAQYPTVRGPLPAILYSGP